MNRAKQTLCLLAAAFLAGPVSQAIAADNAGFGRAIQTIATGTSDGASLEVSSQNKKKKSSKKSGTKCTPEHKAAGHC